VDRDHKSRDTHTSISFGDGTTSGNLAALFGKRRNSQRQLGQDDDNFQKVANELRTNHDLLATQNENLLTELVVLRRKLFESEEKRQQLIQRTNLDMQSYQAKITELKLNLDLLNSPEIGDDDSLSECYGNGQYLKESSTSSSPSKSSITNSTATGST